MTQGTPPHEPRRPRERAMALFIVLIVVVVVTVVVFQLTYSSKIEERISENRKGLLELSYSLISVARDVAMRVHADWVADLDGAEEEDSSSPSPMGQMGGPASSEPPASTDPVDTRHEQDWAHRFQTQMNGIDVSVEITTGESCLNVNYLFDYVRVPEEETDTVGTVDSGEDSEESDEENLPEDDLLLAEEYEPPTEQQIELTTLMLEWLIEAMFQYNYDWDFQYEQLYRPSEVAKSIVDFVLTRQLEPETRRFHRIDFIRELVGPELFYGPKDPALDDEDEEGGGFFGFSEEPEDNFFDSGLDGGLLSEMGLNLDEASGFQEAEDGLGLEEVPRPLGLRSLFCAHSALKEDPLNTPGARQRRQPTINLNTARPEIIVALSRMKFEEQKGDQPQTFEDALLAARRIDMWLNSISEEDLEEDGIAGAAGASGGTSELVNRLMGNAGSDSGSSEGTDPNSEESEEAEQPPEFNVLRQLEDLKKVAEDDPDFPDWASDTSEDISTQKSTSALLMDALKDVAVFRSTFFSATLTGSLKKQPLEGELVLERVDDDGEKRIRVVYWRENVR